MGQVLHGSATTTEAIRRTIQHSQASLRALARRYGINPKTVAKWKKRGSVADLPTGPKDPKSTVLAADVAGYSRLMETDEEGTHERLKTHFEQLINPKIALHRGRIVKTAGDGLLAEFASVVDAMRCAAEIQRAMIDGDADITDERRIRFRIRDSRRLHSALGYISPAHAEQMAA